MESVADASENILEGCCIANESNRKEHSLGLIVGKRNL